MSAFKMFSVVFWQIVFGYGLQVFDSSQIQFKTVTEPFKNIISSKEAFVFH